VAHHLRADLDQLLLQARQRPVLDRLRCCKRAEKVAKIVGERMELEPHGVGRERPARQPCPLDRALAFLDPLFARPALIVESNDALGRAAHVRHDEADAGIKFSGMPLDLGDNPPRLGRACSALTLRLRQGEVFLRLHLRCPKIALVIVIDKRIIPT